MPAQAIIAPLSVQSRGGGTIEVKSVRPRHFDKRRADGCVRRHPAGGHQRCQRHALVAAERQSAGAAIREHVCHRPLERGGEIGAGLLVDGSETGHPMAHRRLQPREREVGPRAPQHRARQIEAPRIPAGSRAFDGRTARIIQAQEPRRLVEGFARRVVDGAAETPIAAHAFDHQKLAVTTRNQQEEIGELDRLDQAHGKRMPLQVIDGEKRQAVDGGDRLSHGHAHDDAADQAGTSGGRDPLKVAEAHSRLRKGAGDQPVQMVEMAARGDFRHHPAEGAVLVELGQHEIGENAPVVGHQSGRRLVATRLDSQHDHGHLHTPFPWSPPRPNPGAAMTPRPIRIGTRGSPLALAQAALVRGALISSRPRLGEAGAVEIVPIRTSGDRIQDRRLVEAGGKGLFTKEIEEALIEGRIDLAVHSMKDMPTWLPEGLAVAGLLPREDPRDALFSEGARRLDELPPGAVVGTSSLRRQAQVLMTRPDLQVVPLRGNVETRLRRLAEGAADATLLAVAGLKRLGLAHRIQAVLEPEEMLPAVAQGAIGVEIRIDDDPTMDLVRDLDDPATRLRITAERALLAGLDGSCRTPIAALAELDETGAILRLRSLIALPDGSAAHRDDRRGPAVDAEAIGDAAALALKAKAGAEFFRALD